MSSRAVIPLVLGLVIGSSPGLALAQDDPEVSVRAACDQFSWPIDRERAWFADERLPRRVSGARLRRIDRAVELTLEPSDRIHFFLPPETRAKPHSFSGEVTFFGVPRPGQYQVTLSSAASIEVFENGTRLKPTGQTSAGNCPGVRESVRFDLAPGDLVLVEIMNASTNSIKVAFAQAAIQTAW